MKFDKLFEPIIINKTEIKNRMVVSAMVTQYCSEDGNATDQYIAYHETKARGGWGLIITEDYAVLPDAGSFRRLPGLWMDSQIGSHRRLTDRVHAAGGKICAQIYHAGREKTRAVHWTDVIAPSAIREPSMPDTPREMTKDEIEQMVIAFGGAALRAKKAGFDMVEIHGAHGYLINQFVSPFANKRTDEYGGSRENRFRFPLEIVKMVREMTGEDFPISYRISTNDYVEGGVDLEDAIALAKELEKAGVDMLHCSQGMFASKENIIPPAAVPRGAYVPNAAAIGEAVDIPVIAVGRINDPVQAEEILEGYPVDMVTMARASLADPELPNKTRDGRLDEINHCIGCVQGCTGENSKGHFVRCTVNPLIGMELAYDLTPAKEPKRVLIAGGGVAGCEAAISAAMKGHQVTLYEKEDKLGGDWRAAAAARHKEEFHNFLRWQQNEMKRLGVVVHLGSPVTADIVKEEDPDALIIASGGTRIMPDVKSLEDPKNIFAAEQILLEGMPEDIPLDSRIFVLGGGLVGCETADVLAQKGYHVFLIEKAEDIARDAEPSARLFLMKELMDANVGIYVNSMVIEIGEDYLIVRNGDGDRSLDYIDCFVSAFGVKSGNPLIEELSETGCRIIVAGNASTAKNGMKNIWEGFEAGLQV